MIIISVSVIITQMRKTLRKVAGFEGGAPTQGAGQYGSTPTYGQLEPPSPPRAQVAHTTGRALSVPSEANPSRTDMLSASLDATSAVLLHHNTSAKYNTLNNTTTIPTVIVSIVNGSINFTLVGNSSSSTLTTLFNCNTPDVTGC
eukprot:4204724-Pyramimonas_sp.AAC.2